MHKDKEGGESESVAVVVREYDAERDGRAVEEVENMCEVGPSGGGKLSLHTHLLGDPICRVRHSPAFLMLVAEMVVDMDMDMDMDKDKGSSRRQIVGMIRGCIKTVTCGTKLSRTPTPTPTPTPNITSINHFSLPLPLPLPLFTKLAYILGLRVSPSHRRMGIGLKLVREIEKWFVQNGAEYSYMATENDNLPSLKLFTDKCGYSKFRTPAILVNPVFAHRVHVSRKTAIVKLAPADAGALYRRRFSTTEFFPRDIDSILENKLTLGTYLAVPAGSRPWPGVSEFLSDPPQSWAVLSVWNCQDVFKLEVRGASRLRRALARTSRTVDGALPWLRLPSVPDVFRPFGIHFLFGLGGEGPNAAKYVKELCGVAHNLARERRCGVVATEVGSREPLRLGIPHWKSLSCAEDLWCIKRLGEDYSDGSLGDWTKSPPAFSIFVDPRDF